MSQGKDKIIDRDNIYIRTKIIPSFIEDDNIILSNTVLYKPKMGNGGLYPFYYINPDDNTENKINVFIANSTGWFSKKFNKISITLNEEDVEYFTNLNNYLKNKAKQSRYNCKNELIKTNDKGQKIINAKFYVKDNKISSKVYDLSKGAKQITNITGYSKCEGNFIIKISGIFKGNVGTFFVIHFVEATITPISSNYSIISRFLGKDIKEFVINNDNENINNEDENLNEEENVNKEENINENEDDDNLPF